MSSHRQPTQQNQARVADNNSGEANVNISPPPLKYPTLVRKQDLLRQDNATMQIDEEDKILIIPLTILITDQDDYTTLISPAIFQENFMRKY